MGLHASNTKMVFVWIYFYLIIGVEGIPITSIFLDIGYLSSQLILNLDFIMFLQFYLWVLLLILFGFSSQNPLSLGLIRSQSFFISKSIPLEAQMGTTLIYRP